jgi:O-antigen ligase
MESKSRGDRVWLATLLGASAFFAVLPYRAIVTFGPLSVGRVFAILTGVLWLVAVSRSRTVAKPPAVVLLFAMLALWASVSVLWSPVPAESARGAFQLWSPVVFSVLLVDLVRTRDALLTLFFALSLGAAGLIVLAVPDLLLQETGRLAVTTSSTTMGGYVALITPLMIYLAFSARDIDTRWAPFVPPVVIFNLSFAPLIVLATGSRGAVLGFGIALVYGLVELASKPDVTRNAIRRIRTFTRASRRQLVGASVAFTVLYAGVVIFVVPDSVLARYIGKTIGVSSPEQLMPGRLIRWRVGLGLFVDNPLTGVGIDASPALSVDTLRSAASWIGYPMPHNAVVRILAELGFVGLLLVALPYFTWAREVGGMTPENRRLWAAVGSVLVLFVLVDVWFGNPLFILVPVLATIHARLPEG